MKRATEADFVAIGDTPSVNVFGHNFETIKKYSDMVGVPYGDFPVIENLRNYFANNNALSPTA